MRFGADACLGRRLCWNYLLDQRELLLKGEGQELGVMEADSTVVVGLLKLVDLADHSTFQGQFHHHRHLEEAWKQPELLLCLP